MTNSLLEAHDMGLSSIAVPALGTGAAGVPGRVCASVMLHEVVQFSCQHPQTTLKTVRFVTHPQDQGITQVGGTITIVCGAIILFSINQLTLLLHASYHAMM